MPDTNNGNQSMSYSANDWFYMKNKTGDKCDPENKMNNEKSCVENKTAVKELTTSTNLLGASLTQYNDAKMLYNRELLFTVNILVGLAMLCYYIYLNQSVIPSPANVIASVGEVIGKKPGTTTT